MDGSSTASAARYSDLSRDELKARIAAGVSDEPINHEEVMQTGARVTETFKELLRRLIPRLASAGLT